jgi:AhpD family alkylhydroperoxidase
MAHIDLGIDETQFPGINGPMRFRPETAGPLNQLANIMLHDPHPTLSPGERELIAAYVSGLNDCNFCCSSHSAFAAAQLKGGMPLVRQVLAASGADGPLARAGFGADHQGAEVPPVSGKLQALLHIAGAVQRGGRSVTPELVAQAREEGATDLEIHDTVLIAAAFCMFNRYVDGLGTLAPADQSRYAMAAQRILQHGYGAA